MFSEINRQPIVGILFLFSLWLLNTPILSNAHETEWPGQKLASIFPMANKFVQRNAVLTAEKVAAIEKDLGAKLRIEDQKPVFYIPIDGKKKPMGLVLFTDAEGPHGVIEGAIGLDMKGKVVKVVIYEHKEAEAITNDEFLEQFMGRGIEDAFKVGEDVVAVEGQEAASRAVALIPKKTLVMSYALFLKRKAEPKPAPEPELPEEDMPEVDDLKALMALMIDDYFVIVDYFDDKASKVQAVTAAKRLANYGKLLSDFEPPKNADQAEEYGYLQDKFSESLVEFAKKLQQDGNSEATREQWTKIVEVVDQAHLRFSEEEIDLDAY